MTLDPIAQILHNFLTPGDYKERILEFHFKNLDALKIYPASRSNHHCYAGGYYEHVLEVANNVQTLLPLCVIDGNGFNVDDVFVAVYFHDIDKACSTVPGESYRYIFDAESPTDKQINYARSLNIEFDLGEESKTSLSYRIDCAQKGIPCDEYKIPRFIERPGILPVDDCAIVASICAHNGITLNNQVLSAICTHHGGWAPLVIARNAQPTPLGVLLHLADMVSAFLQNGQSLGR